MQVAGCWSDDLGAGGAEISVTDGDKGRRIVGGAGLRRTDELTAIGAELRQPELAFAAGPGASLHDVSREFRHRDLMPADGEAVADAHFVCGSSLWMV